MLSGRRLGVVMALVGFALANFVVDLEMPLRPEPNRLAFALILFVALPCSLGLIGRWLGSQSAPSRLLGSFLTVLALAPPAIVIAALVSVLLESPDLWIVLRRVGGLSLVPAMIVLTLSRVRVAVPLASPAAPAALRAAWTVPALFASAAQVHIAHAVDFAHRHQRPGLTVALGWLGAVGLAAFVVADLRLLRRIGTALDARDGSRPVAPDGDQLLGFAAASYVKRSLAWNLACAVLAAGSVLWAGFNGGGTYGW